MDFSKEFLVPGDKITTVKSHQGVTILGPGLRRNEENPNTLIVTQSGKLKFKAPNIYWIEGRRTRYIPKRGDLVVGVVVKKMGDMLKVDIGSAEYALLSMLAFEGATKKQKPDVNVGDVIYARLLNAYREMEPELVCIDAYYKAGRLGVLSSDKGFLINVSQKLTHMLLNVENPLLRTLGKKFPFEVAVGVNGRVWINGKTCKDVFTVLKAFSVAETQDEKGIVEACRKIY